MSIHSLPLPPARPAKLTITEAMAAPFRFGASREPPTEKSGTDWNWFLDFIGLDDARARRALADWDRRRGKVEGWNAIKADFMRFNHERLHSLTWDEVEDAISRGEHALGDIPHSVAKHNDVHNFSPPVPFVFTFHELLEGLGRVPTWRDIEHLVHVARPDRIIEPFRNFLVGKKLDADAEMRPGTLTMQAFQWRVGNAFYSWLREIHLLAVLRERHRVDVRYHFLADAEWRADLVAGNVLLVLYVENAEYRKDDEGRKVRCGEMNPGKLVRQHKLKVRSVRGKPWLVEPYEVDDLARLLERLGAPMLPPKKRPAFFDLP